MPSGKSYFGQYCCDAHCSANLVQTPLAYTCYFGVSILLACREALLCQAGGPEEFLAMRANYAASLAAVSITGYIAGAGDRHLENFLLHTPSGTLVPIDFGCGHAC